MHPDELRRWCDTAFERYHHRSFISPDPLELVLPYRKLEDREVAGFIAAALATGRVNSILGAGRWVLDRLPSPHDSLTGMGEAQIERAFAGFSYRFFDGRQLSGLLIGVKRLLEEHGSLEACLASCLPPDQAEPDAGCLAEPEMKSQPAIESLRGAGRLVSGLDCFVSEVRAGAGGRLDESILVPQPARGSACKRLLLFLRWMVRSDEVDPGGWKAISPRELLVPVDTHMLSVCRSLGLTTAKQPSLRVSFEITAGFRAIAPEDPVAYDFSLTRLGIHPEGRNDQLRRKIGGSA